MAVHAADWCTAFVSFANSADMALNPDFVGDVSSFADEFGEVMRRIERAASTPQFGSREGRVLLALARSPRQQAALGRDLDMDTGQLARVSNLLQDRGLLTRMPNPAGRGHLLQPTETGLSFAMELSERQRDIAKSVLADMSASARANLTTTARVVGEYMFEQGWSKECIRPATLGDLPLLVRGALATFGRQHFGYNPEQLEIYFMSIASIYLTERPGTRIGLVAEHYRTIAAAFLAVEQSPDTLQILWLGVTAFYMGRGVGTALLEQGVIEAKKLRYRYLRYGLPSNVSPNLPSFPSTMPGWEHVKTEEPQLCGRTVDWEIWQIALS